jgi:hypothetical protein
MAVGGEEQGALDLGNGEIWVSDAAVAAEVVRGVAAVGFSGEAIWAVGMVRPACQAGSRLPQC